MSIASLSWSRFRNLFGRPRRSSRRRRDVFTAQFDGGTGAVAPRMADYLGCDTLERRIVLTASPATDFLFSSGVITGYVGPGGAVKIPSQINGTPVTVIGQNAFANIASITSVTIPRSVQIISFGAFSGDTGLTSVAIGGGVTYIGANAFTQCTALKRVAIPNSVQSIGTFAFGGTALTSVVIPNSLTAISEGLFYHADKLTSVTIPNSVASIGAAAFLGTALTSVVVPNSVSSIGDGAFAFNTALTKVKIGKHVTNIVANAFFDDSALASVTFLGNAPTVGTDAFTRVATGAKAFRASNLTGYGSDGSNFHGLVVATPR